MDIHGRTIIDHSAVDENADHIKAELQRLVSKTKVLFLSATPFAYHLRDDGRIIALLPTGNSADSKFNKWYEAQPEAYQVAEISLPSCTFERASTSVATHSERSYKAMMGLLLILRRF